MTLHAFLWRAENVYPDREIVSRTHEGIHRYTYSEYADRVRRLASALDRFGVGRGDRVATFAWNTHWHHETYYGVPCMGAQLHMINLLLPEGHVRHIVSEAEDKVIVADPTMLDALENAYDEEAFESVELFVVTGEEAPETDLEPVVDYESFIADGDPDYEFPEVSEDRPAGMCYTSGTTGKPKGVEYTHKMYWGHTMAGLTGELGLRDTSVEMTVVPMFHVSGWGRPFMTVAAGAKTVLPGPNPDAADLASLIEEEGVTHSAAVPTVWRGLLQYAEEHDPDLSSLEYVMSGGSSTPKALARDYRDRLDATLVTGYGMTEMTPVTHSSARRYDSPTEGEGVVEFRSKAGLIHPGVRMRVVDDDGEEIEWDGEEYGELLMKGPWVTTEYFNAPEKTAERITEDGWLRTGDIVTVDERGYMEVVDRVDDLVKSGGEWISSVEVENLLMGDDRVLEAAVIPVSHERWDERPAAFAVARDDVDDLDSLAEDLRDLVAEEYPRYWVPDAVEFIDDIPKGSTGKFSKITLKREYVDEDVRAAVDRNAPGAD